MGGLLGDGISPGKWGDEGGWAGVEGWKSGLGWVLVAYEKGGETGVGRHFVSYVFVFPIVVHTGFVYTGLVYT